MLDAGAVTALRTGAAAVLAAETLGRADATAAAVIGAGVNGRAAARTFLAPRQRASHLGRRRGRARRPRPRSSARRSAGSLEEALAADLLVTVTPGHELLLADGSLRPGQHVSLMGADGPGKAEIAATELARTRMFCDDWEQASHGGELAHAVEAGLVGRTTSAGSAAVLAGEADGPPRRPTRSRRFDSTGLAIQDLAIALAALERADELDLALLQL